MFCTIIKLQFAFILFVLMMSLQVKYMLVIIFSDFTIKNYSYVPAWKWVVDMRLRKFSDLHGGQSLFSLEDIKAMWKPFFGSCKILRNSLLLLQQLSVVFHSFIS